MEGYLHNPKAKQLLAELTVKGQVGSFVLKQGLIYFKERMWLPEESPMKAKILQALHSSAVGGHSGFPVTYHRVKKLFAWSRMKKEIKDFVATCEICQQAKPERVKYPGLLAPLRVPKRAWRDVSMDFIEGVPKAGGYNSILVVVDRFSKYAHFVPLSHPFTATSVATAYMNHVFKLHGMPQSIVSDRDKIFTSNFWKELHRVTGVELRFSSSYHPETDGQTERVNQCLEGYLRCFVHGCPHKWIQWLPLAEFWYNTAKHSSLDKSPFEVVYGQEPIHLGIDRLESCAISDVQEWLQEREQMRDILHQHLVRVQLRMKHQADKKRTERQFQVGDEVYLKLQPYIQKSVATRANQKLSFRYYGPYPVLQRVGAMAYKLKLPEAAKIHPVVHVSQLKKALKAGVAVQQELPRESNTPCVPLQILEQRPYMKGTSQATQILVHWSGMSQDLATWEDEHELKAKFPEAPAWGQAAGKEEGNVSNLTPSVLLEELQVSSGDQNEALPGHGPSPVQPKKAARVRIPCRRYTGPDWTR